MSARAFSHIVLLKRHRPGDIRGIRREAVYGSNAPSNGGVPKQSYEKRHFLGTRRAFKSNVLSLRRSTGLLLAR